MAVASRISLLERGIDVRQSQSIPEKLQCRVTTAWRCESADYIVASAEMRLIKSST